MSYRVKIAIQRKPAGKPGWPNINFDYEKEFKYTGKYLGETSAHFHEHLAVPADAPAGEYHLHFTVTDADGNSTTEEVEGIQITK